MQQQSPKTSFIPKKSFGNGNVPDSKRKRRSGKGRGPGIFFMLSVLILLIAGGGALAVFLYEQYLEKSIERKEASLERARDAFDPSLIEELSRLDTRMNAAATILGQHVAPSLLFDELERLTLRSVQFTNFAYQMSDANATISMEGEATGFEAVALQSDAFGESDLIQEPVFSNVNLNEVGNVTFSFSGTVVVNRLLYTDAIDTLQRGAVGTAETQTQQTDPNEE